MSERTFLVKQGSLTQGTETLLVNAANTNCRLGSGVSGAIRLACGASFQEHIYSKLQERFDGPMEPGQVLITDAGEHRTARYVAHVAVMDYRNGYTAASFPDLVAIERCCVNLWKAIEELDSGNVSIAMVALGGGTGKLGVRKPTELACTTLRSHLKNDEQSVIGDVTFYGYELPEYLAMLEVVASAFPVPQESIPDDVREFMDRKKQ